MSSLLFEFLLMKGQILFLLIYHWCHYVIYLKLLDLHESLPFMDWWLWKQYRFSLLAVFLCGIRLLCFIDFTCFCFRVGVSGVCWYLSINCLFNSFLSDIRVSLYRKSRICGTNIGIVPRMFAPLSRYYCHGGWFVGGPNSKVQSVIFTSVLRTYYQILISLSYSWFNYFPILRVQFSKTRNNLSFGRNFSKFSVLSIRSF